MKRGKEINRMAITNISILKVVINLRVLGPFSSKFNFWDEKFSRPLRECTEMRTCCDFLNC